MTKRVRSVFPDCEDTCSLNPFETKAATNEEKRQRMKKILKATIEIMLTARQQKVVKLYYFEEKKVSEIAELLGVNKASVYRHLKASKRKIDKIIKPIEQQLSNYSIEASKIDFRGFYSIVRVKLHYHGCLVYIQPFYLSTIFTL